MRITYLDHLRAVCMVFVVVLHAYYLIDYTPAAPFAVFIYNFCMGTFFIISGYVMAATLPHGPIWPHLKDRLRRLAWPLATGLLLVNPLTLAIIHKGFSADWAQDVLTRTISGRLFVHLWFLFSLMGFIIAVPLILRALRSAAWLRVTSVHVPPAYIATSITLVVVAVQMLVAATVGLDLPVPFDGFTKYAWAYVAGLALFQHPKAWAAVHNPGPLPFAIAGLFWLAMVDGWSTPGTTLHHALHAARIASSTAAISFALLWAFRRFFNRTTPIWSFISQGALTTYILQWLTLHALLFPLTALGLQGGALFTALIVCTLAIKLPLHHFLVMRVPILSLLLNGNPVKSAKNCRIVAKPARGTFFSRPASSRHQS
ncbi:surface polysaccharide O-acyltransferase-like enzyme [Litoreibacter meonggei]|uniref:Surface polysaccharide O-acyltransferase-like enzyme n=1 Tax=Litoreibacter meonggei TaxID=1049199 RepID=A0A497X1G5_9RHOB|nr:acyltransferase family protein [Litoreibacter meonggei]RLJ59465.1 surface polysaccharide O-acyltransferase-like enzyme [Litoreibacter meonggei]